MRRWISLTFVILTLLVTWPKNEPLRARTTFRSVRSGMWSDPATWGYPPPAQVGVSIPDRESYVIVARGTRVLLDSPHIHVKKLEVHVGGVLQAAVHTTLTVTQDVDIEGTLLGTSGYPLTLTSLQGNIVNGGLILGGASSSTYPIGGPVILRAQQGRVENWGHLQGGSGSPGGWVFIEAPAGLIRNRGEIRGGSRGGDVVLRAPTLDLRGGKVLGGGQNDGERGTLLLTGTHAILAGGRSTRLSGRGIFTLVGSGVLDAPDQETMGWLAEDRGIWLLGSPDAHLNLTGNEARFPPFHALEGGVHMWFSSPKISTDPGISTSDLSTTPLETHNGQQIPFFWFLPYPIPTPAPGSNIVWRWEMFNLGHITGQPVVTVTDQQGWSLELSPTPLPALEPGTHRTVSLTVHVPEATPIGTVNRLTLRVQAEGMPTSVEITVPVRVAPHPMRLPWLGHRARFSRSRAVVSDPIPLQVFLTWPNAGQNAGLPEHSVLFLHPLDGAENITGGDIAYWDGQRWVPIATTADLENFTEDQLYIFAWDASHIPLTALYMRGRLWTADGRMGEVVRSTFLHHAPVAQATAMFLGGGVVRLNAGDSVDLDGDIVAYHWDFGDGEEATGSYVEHTFSPGLHIVRLRVTDATDQWDENVYLLDTSVNRWEEQRTCGCASMQVYQAGTTDISIPWEDENHQNFGLDVAALPHGHIVRLHLGVEAQLTEGSNPRACRVEQRGRVRWRMGEEEYTSAWHWNGRAFPAGEALPLGLIGYTRPNALASWEGTRIRWLFGLGWGSRIIPRGLPETFLNGEGIVLDGTYQAHVDGATGSCSCTWTVHLRVATGSPPVVTVNAQCGK